MTLLIVFLLRLSFGLAAAMATVSHRQVSGGYFRNHLYVVLGLTALAALLCIGRHSDALPYAAAAALVSYVGAVGWLYESPRLGKGALIAAAGLAAIGLVQVGNSPADYPEALPDLAAVLRNIQPFASGLLTGLVTAAMLLGHWYLNAPGMKLQPLNRLIALSYVALALQTAVCGIGIWCELQDRGSFASEVAMIAVRWSFGLVGVAVLLWMARQTLKIPNTQSATGILYVAVIGCFTGEIMSQVLSVKTAYPV
ncbi:hypothetical protein OAS39_01035 [Pirellulales bacterium]|nr:hypothetical protein [Pirellulales bacterium]